MTDLELLGADILELDFEYPLEYKDFIQNLNGLNGTPWWLIGTSKGFSKSCYEFINLERKSTKFLVPFAKNDETNILACFDKTHRVWFCGLEDDDIANANWSERYSMPSFSAWLDRVLSGDL
jgi:hypothetical protein